METQPHNNNDNDNKRAQQEAVFGPELEAAADLELPLRRDTPRIWVASLSDYNNGCLYGRWLDADRETEDIWQDIQDLLASAPTPGAEEWAIFDYENFGEVQIQEYESIDTVSALALGIRDNGLAFTGWAAIQDDHSRARETFEDAFLGQWDSVEDFAANLLDDYGLQDAIDRQVPEGLRCYVQIDVAGFARDLEIGGDISTVEATGGGVWIYDGNV